MLVAKIAQLNLQKINPEALQLAENITAVVNPFSHGKVKSFVESASWADDVKQYQMNMMDTWHYLDVPVRLNDSDPHPHFDHGTSDSLALMKNAMKVLLKWNHWEIKDQAHETMEKSMMLRYLTHVVGDIHQPLHSASLFDDELFPKGDMGGNLFKINYTSNINNLHKFWDSAADSLDNNITRPLTNETSSVLEKMAIEIMKEFPENATNTTIFAKTAENKAYPFEDWIIESFQFAKNQVYRNITHMGNVTEAYKKAAATLCRERISAGGFRLSHLIQDIYAAWKNKTLEPEASKFLYEEN